MVRKNCFNDTAQEERELEEAAGDMTCDSTSGSADEADTGKDETTEEDRRFMAEARERAMRSEDEQTKVCNPTIELVH